MFDGNHRSTRRPVNLSGGGGGRRRKASAALSSSPTYGTAGVGAATTSTTTTVSSSTAASSLSSSPYLSSSSVSSNGVTALNASFSPSAAAAATTTTISNTSTNSFNKPQLNQRALILEETRRQRQERQKVQAKIKAAIHIQRVIRRYLVQQRLSNELEQRFNSSSSTSFLHEDQALTTTTQLNIRLGLPVRTTNPDQTRWDWCQEYARRIQQATAAAANSPSLPPTIALAHRILQTSLRLLPPPSEQQEKNSKQIDTTTLTTLVTRVKTCQTILQFCMGYDTSSSCNSSIQNHDQQREQLFWKKLGGPSGFQTLVDTLQYLLTIQPDGDSAGDSTASSSFELVSAFTRVLWNLVVLVTPPTRPGKALLGAFWLSSSNNTQNDRNSIKHFLQLEQSDNMAMTQDQLCKEWFIALVDILTSPQLKQQQHQLIAPSPSSSLASDSIVISTVSRIVSPANELTILNNALHLHSRSKNPAYLVRLLDCILSKRHDLAFLSSWVTRGDDSVESLIASLYHQDGDAIMQDKQQQHNSNRGGDLSDDDESDTEDDPNNISDGRTHHHHNTTRNTTATSSSTTNRLTKQEIQTLPKIDRLYHTEINITTANVTNTIRNSSGEQMRLVHLAKQIGGDAVQWLVWGEALLNSSSDTSVTTIVPNNYDQQKDDIQVAQAAYVTMLALLLQTTTGLRARQSVSSAFLTKLAFDVNFVDSLWRFVSGSLANLNSSNNYNNNNNNSTTSHHEELVQKQTIAYTALSVFCDVFSHRLVALKDDQFLEAYTTLMDDNEHHHNGTTKTMSQQRSILADQVIVHLRDILYQLYWTNPVRATTDIKLPYNNPTFASSSSTYNNSNAPDLKLAAVRGRLLVTGTKLWNSLYERWCRLYRRSPFCDEATWLFPTLTTLSGESAVAGIDRIRRARMGGIDFNVDMEDDEDDAGPRGRSSSRNNVHGGGNDDDDDGDHPMTAADIESDALANSFSDPKMARILTCIPQALPFNRRVRLFHSLLTADKMKTQDESSSMREAMLMMLRGEEAEISTSARVEIRRERLYDDSMRQLNQLGPKLKRRVQVSFINQHGAPEAGIDGGGVFKEFIDDLIKDAFSIDNTTQNHLLFTVTPLETLAVNSALKQDSAILQHYEFLGRVLGKAVYESILVEPQFCLPFLNQLLGKSNTLEDLKNFDSEYYRNLIKLLSLTANEIDNLGLTFELTLGNTKGARTVELMPGGHSKAVTKENVIQYVHWVAHQRLNVETATQTKAFLRGFRDLVPASWVRLFSAYELQKLISGDDSIRGIDVPSLKHAMRYAAGYHPSQPVIQWFWEIMEEMTAEEQRKFLRFMTSCSRQPLLGFGSLDPPPCIQQIRLPETMFLPGADPDRKAPLPTSATCMNLLKLPNYKDKNLMKRKLLAAIESGAGFELT